VGSACLLGAVGAWILSLAVAASLRLNLRKVGVGAAAFGAMAAAVVLVVASGSSLSRELAAVLVFAITLAGGTAAVLVSFYRDPDRTPPERTDVAVSPADGVVLYVHGSRKGELPVANKRGHRFQLDELVRTPLRSDDALVVGIALGFLDVHVNRSPIPGLVTTQRRFPGRFGTLKETIDVYTNERATTVIDGRDLQVAVVLIASRLVRRIISYVKEGDQVALGQRIGMIRFGSQVDVVIPDRPGLQVVVAPGQRLHAGETVIAEFLPVAAADPAV
jgi:phosphatidylserine decarboxylase